SSSIFSHYFMLYLRLFILYSTLCAFFSCFFFFNDPATTEIYTLSLHDALPISRGTLKSRPPSPGTPCPLVTTRWRRPRRTSASRSEEHTSELQSLAYLVCRLLLEKKKNKHKKDIT